MRGGGRPENSGHAIDGPGRHGRNNAFNYFIGPAASLSSTPPKSSSRRQLSVERRYLGMAAGRFDHWAFRGAQRASQGGAALFFSTMKDINGQAQFCAGLSRVPCLLRPPGATWPDKPVNIILSQPPGSV